MYEPGYADKIASEFERNRDADMILFNITVEEARRTYHITERRRVRWYNCGRYGAVSFAVRRDSLLASGVTFPCCSAAAPGTAAARTACF